MHHKSGPKWGWKLAKMFQRVPVTAQIYQFYVVSSYHYGIKRDKTVQYENFSWKCSNKETSQAVITNQYVWIL